ncbi:ankyrin repeat domain-containing protein [Candidatus Latescibacterota bacterium]
MWPFGSHKQKTLSHAVLEGNLRAVRRMLDQGADPNTCDPDDNAYPIHYALNHGPEMVQLLIDHGADVNIPGRGNATSLAKAESRGDTEIASILRKAGAHLRTDNDEFTIDPRIRLRIEHKLRELVLIARIHFPTESPEQIADRVGGKINLELPKNMPFQEQEKIQKDIRTLIIKECGEKD